MCLVTYQKVIKAEGNTARLLDGRIVRTDGIENIKSGDYLEVYANIALSKRTISENASVNQIRKGII
jgi:hypothetical protein